MVPTPERRCTPTPERRCAPTPERRRTPTPCADERTPRAPAHTNKEDLVEEERNVTIFPPIREQEQPLSYRTGLPVRTPGPGAPAPCSQQPPTDGPMTPQVAFVHATPPTGPATPPGPPRPLQDELKAIHGAGQSQIRAIAWRLAHHLRDTASVGFFVMVLSLVAAGSAPVERLLAAYVAADRSKGKAQKPGAIFVATWSGWQPPLKPSEINRPKSLPGTLSAGSPCLPLPCPGAGGPSRAESGGGACTVAILVGPASAPVCRDRPATAGRTWRTWGRDLTGRLGAGVPTGSAAGLLGPCIEPRMISAPSARCRAILRRDERAGSLAWGIYEARVEDG